MSDRELIAVKNALAAKGPVEDEIARLDLLMKEMAGVVVDLVPGLTWSTDGQQAYLGCQAVPGDLTSAASRALPTIVFDGPIPEDVWPQAMSRVQDIAARVGATELVVRQNSPANHDVQWIGSDKVKIGLGTRKASIVTAQTGCYLRPSDMGKYPQ